MTLLKKLMLLSALLTLAACQTSPRPTLTIAPDKVCSTWKPQSYLLHNPRQVGDDTLETVRGIQEQNAARAAWCSQWP